MIALNEILNNKKLYEEKYKLMGKRYNLNKIIASEEKFIVLDRQNNENRAKCNRLCSQVADLVNNNQSTSELIFEINKLDKKIMKGEKQSARAMQKINRNLKKLHNLPLEQNTLNEHIKTTVDANFSTNDFFAELAKISEINNFSASLSRFLNSQKNVVFKAENLPIITKCRAIKSKQTMVIFCDKNAIQLFDNLVEMLSKKCKFLIIKSIKSLKKDSEKEVLCTLENGTNIDIEFLGEYVSREKMIKYYDKSLDMTKFVSMIRITVK